MYPHFAIGNNCIDTVTALCQNAHAVPVRIGDRLRSSSVRPLACSIMPRLSALRSASGIDIAEPSWLVSDISKPLLPSTARPDSSRAGRRGERAPRVLRMVDALARVDGYGRRSMRPSA